MFGISRKEHIRIWKQLCTDTKAIRELAKNVRHLEKYFGDDISALGRKVNGLTKGRDRIWDRLNDIDKYLQRNPPIQKTDSNDSALAHYRSRIIALRGRLERANEAIQIRTQEVADLDARIQSLLDEIRAKNVTIARLEGAEVRIESSGEPEIPCQS